MSSDEAIVRGHDQPGSDLSVLGMATVLWPSPATVQLDRTGGHSARTLARYLPLPSAEDPRLLLPARPRLVAAVAVRHQPVTSVKGRIRRDLAGIGVRVGLPDIALRRHISVVSPDPAADTIEGLFRRQTGTGVLLSMHFGKPRANRKPVVQVLSPTGETLGFAKIGVNALTNALVRTENAALQLLSTRSLQHITTADVVFNTVWRGLEIVMARPLPVWGRPQPVSETLLLAATQEVAALVPVSTLTLRDWLDACGLRDRLAGLTPGAAASGLHAAVADAIAGAGDVRLHCGAWHGDWTPWNMAAAGDRLLVWDWERFTSPAPIGFDALHHSLQQALVSRRDPARQATEDLVGRAQDLLHPYGVAAGDAPVVVMAYLAELACRYLHDGQEQAGARLGRVADWLLPVLTSLATAR